MSAAPAYDEWERQTAAQIEAQGVTFSDALAMIEAQPFTMAQAWGQGLSAEATAQRLTGTGHQAGA